MICIIFKVIGNIKSIICGEIKVFPNPSNESISVNMPISDDVDYQIVSLEGKIIKSGTLSNTLPSVDISSLSNDIYFLKINNEVLKFVVKR